MITSVILWKRNHPEDFCVLYADDITIDFFSKLKVLEIWDKVEPLPHKRKINKSVFWASSKLQVLAEIQEPVILMDNDTHVYKPIKHLLDLTKVYVTNFEIGKGYYPTAIDPFIRKLKYRPRWKTESVNVSFLNLPDPVFTRKYANESIKMMEEFTEMGVPNSQYLIFAEQLLLKHMLEKENIEYRSILSNYWDCKKWDWGNLHERGIWDIEKSEVHFKHYGPLKTWYLDNIDGFNYEEHIKHLENCINIHTLDKNLFSKR